MTMRIGLFVLFIFAFILSACGSDLSSISTTEAVSPTVAPKETAVRMPVDLPTLNQTSPAATVSPASFPSSTLAAASFDEEGIHITAPAPHTQVTAGQPYTFSGTAMPMQGTSLTLRLQVAYAEVFSTTVPVDAQTGTWSLTMDLLPIAGPAALRLVGAMDTVVVDFALMPPADMPGPLVMLDQPAIGETAVAGYMLFLHGTARDLLDDRLYMAILSDSCTRTAAAFSIELTTGIWNGELVLPANTTPGPACVVAYTGTRGEDEWQEARVPITIVSADDERAAFIRLGNGEDLAFQAGETTDVYGIAANAPDSEVQVTLSLDDSGGGQVLETGTADVNTFGYWKIQMQVSEDKTGAALLTVSMGSGVDYMELRQKTAVLPRD